jgi:FtsH-binding integral membrane protein
MYLIPAFAALAVFGTVGIALAAGIAFRFLGSLHPFKRGIALASSFMASAVLGCGLASLVLGLWIRFDTEPHSSASVAAFLGTIFGTGLVCGCVAAWLVDRLVVRCLWWGGPAARRAP